MGRSSPQAPAPAARQVHKGHDHGACVATILDRARHSFGTKGLRLTSLRLQVLEEIAASHDAMGAYDVIGRLAQRTGTKLAPISVYRAIDALLEAGLVHRLESKNAYFACHAPHAGQQRHIALVCETCSRVVEVPAGQVYELIDAAGHGRGFQLHSAVAEGVGQCAVCRDIYADTTGRTGA